MNINVSYRSLGALATTIALLGAACTDSSSPASDPSPSPGERATYRTRDNRLVSYVISPEAKLREVTVSHGSRTTINIVTEAPMSLTTGGPLAIDVHFSDGREVALARNFAYPSRDAFERAAVLDASTGAVLGKVDVEVVDNRLTLSFDGRLVNGAPLVAVSRYLPSAEAVAEARGGLESEYATMLSLDPTAGGNMSAVPFATNRVKDRSSFAALPPGDVHWGPPAGTTNFNPTTPVITVPTGNGNIDLVDLTGDFDTGYTDCAGNAIVCGWFTWTAQASFIGGCGADLNGNGKLDANEIENWFGFCAFPSAVNDTWQDANGNIHWENAGGGTHAGEIYEYIIDPTTGELEVWYSDDGGVTWTLEYEGPGQGGPNGWGFFPKPVVKAACPVFTSIERRAQWGGVMGAFNQAHLAN